MRIQYIRPYTIYPWLPTRITYPKSACGAFIPTTKKFVFKPLRAEGARQPSVEASISMRLAAMVDGRYCCGDAIGR